MQHMARLKIPVPADHPVDTPQDAMEEEDEVGEVEG